MKKRTLGFAVAGFGAVGLTGAALIRTFARHPVGNAAVPQPAKRVQIERYLGRWYEIARYEQWFEKGCQGVTADYSLKGDGNIGVRNRCRKPGGRIDETRGIAKIVDHTTNAKLKVSFFRPFYGDYWVLDHATDYSWAIVGEPSGRYLWLLAREAVPSAALVNELMRRAQAMGYDTSMLIRTMQP